MAGISLSNLVQTTTVADSDILLVRQGTEDKKVTKEDLVLGIDHSKLANLNDVGGHDAISKRRFPSITDMGLYTAHLVGKIYSVGSTDWKVVNTTGYALLGGLKAIPLNGLHLADFGLSVDNSAAGNVTSLQAALDISAQLLVSTMVASYGSYSFNGGFQLTSPVTIKGDPSTTRFNFSHSGDIACFDVKANGIKFIDIKADVNHTSAPTNGGVGNIIQIGAYASVAAELYNDIELTNLELTKSGTYKNNTTVIGIYNRCNNIKARNIVIDGGSSGVICHWSGDFDTAFPDTSPATATWHPFNIDFKNLIVRNGVLAVSISGCYDTLFSKVIAENCTNGLYVLPGDFTNTRADPTQKPRVGDNVVCKNFTVSKPTGLAVQVIGNGGRGVFSMLTTARTTLKNFTVIATASPTHSALFVDKAYNCIVDNFKAFGYGTRDAISALTARNFTIKDSEVYGQRGVVIAGCIGVLVENTDVIGNGTDSSIGIKVSEMPVTTATLTANVAEGATTINVAATTLVIYGGQEVVFPNGKTYEIAADDYFPVGTTNMIIEPATSSQTSGTVGNILGNSKDVTIRGGKSTKHLYGVEIEDGSSNITVDDVNFFKNRRNDIYVHGTLNKDIKLINNSYSQSNTTRTANTANVRADFVDNLVITGSNFNEVSSDVSTRFGVNLGADVSNANINTNTCHGVQAGGVFVFHTTQSAAALARGKNFIGLNRMGAGVTQVSGTGYDTVTTVAV